MNYRHLKETIAKVICGAAALFAAGMLILIIAVIFLRGIASLNLHFILTPDSNTAYAFGTGMANAIVGTFLLAVISTLLAIPFAIGTAIYLKKYAPDNRFTRFLRLMIEVLAGTPSIVLGVVALFLLVVYLKPITGGESLLAGSIALAALIIPVIERATEDAIDRVPCELEEGSYALGATKWQTIRDILIPSAFSGIVVGAILGFGRAAEESAVVLLTVGYSQHMPEFMIAANHQMLLGFKIYPLNNLVGTIPVYLYTAYENSNVYPLSSVFAAAFVLIVIVMLVNLLAKAILFYTKARMEGHQSAGRLSSIITSIAGYLGRVDRGGPKTCTDTLKEEDPAILTAPGKIPKITEAELPAPEEVHQKPEAEPASSVAETSSGELSPAIPKKSPSAGKWRFRSPVNGIINGVREVIQKRTSPVPLPQDPQDPPKEKPKRRVNLRDFIRPFLFTLIPFLLVAALLLGLSRVFPVLNPAGTGGVLDFFKSIVIALVIGAICAIIALFLLRRSARILGLKKKNPLLGNRTGAMVAVVTGICLVLVGAFILSAHLFVPPITKVSAAQEAAATSSAGVINTPIFSFNIQPQDLITLQKMNNLVFSFDLQNGDLQVRVVNQTITEMNVSVSAMAGGTENLPAAGTGTVADKSARLAAFLAQQDAGDENTVSTAATVTSSPATTLTPAPVAAAPASAPAVPDKYALDLGESYWYGDNYRPCLATVYDTTVLPFYFWWDMDWNRFVQQSPAQSGDVFLVIFIRIEDTGNMSAVVPSADSFVVVNNGRTYTHESYFDTSVLSQNEINYYSANFDKLPYQWIREIGDQKRDYAFLTGYNVFGENQTLITNYTGLNSALVPPSPPDTNGQGYFIKPGRSNAIDGYLIYEVPAAVAADLKDTYVQVSFNSFSPAQWRLDK